MADGAMCSSFIETEVINSIGCIIINNGIQNKIDSANFLNLDLFKKWIDGNNLKGLIIYGEGRHFSIGANIEIMKSLKNNVSELELELNKGKEILNYIEHLPIITVAAISGACFGAGFEISLSCQYRICTKNSMFSFPEAGLGLMPGLGGTIRLPRLIGKNKARRIILSTEVVSCEEAYDLGIVDKIVNKGESFQEAVKLIENLTEGKTREQLNNILNSINDSSEDNIDKYFKLESNMFANLVKEAEL